jgi:hypothetical protein
VLNKITDAQMNTYGVVSAPDRLSGTAAENKAIFDRLIRSVVAIYFNALVDALTATTGAGEIGAAVAGIDENNVLGVLATLKALRDSDASSQGAANSSFQAEIDNRYTKGQTDALVGAKFDTVKANELVKSITFNSDTGVFTITTQGGAVTTIDTLLEKVPASFSLENNQLVLTLEDGTKQTADLSAFIDTYTFTSGGTIIFSQNGKDITAEVKDGSLALSKLTSEAQATLASYATRAEAAKEAAEVAKAAAEAAKSTAQSAATTATNQASAASASATQAKNSQTAAKTSENNAKASETNAKASENAAKQYAEEAKAAAGGDYVTNETFNEHKANATHIAEEERTKWNGKAEVVKTGQITLTAAGWAGEGPFTQAVSHANIGSNTQVNIDASIALLDQMEADGVVAIFIENDGGAATAYAKGAAFTADLTIDVTFVEVTA